MFSQNEKIQFVAQFDQALHIYEMALEKFPCDGETCANEECAECSNDCLKTQEINRSNFIVSIVNDERWNVWSKNPLIKLAVKCKKE